MSFNYQAIRPEVFTEDGQTKLIAIRDEIRRLCKIAGCCTIEKAMIGGGGTWLQLACIYRIEEMGEISIKDVGVTQYAIIHWKGGS